MKKQRRPRFDAGDFLEVEAYLKTCHKEGRHFVSAAFGNRFVFQDGKAEDYTYRLDFPDKTCKREEFLARAKALGWSSRGKILGWECLAKAGVCACEEEERAGLFHTALERGRHGRGAAERECIIGVLPMVVLFFIGSALQDTACASAIWELTTLALIVAAAVALPAFRVRGKCGAVMDQWRKEHTEAPAPPPAAERDG